MYLEQEAVLLSEKIKKHTREIKNKVKNTGKKIENLIIKRKQIIT